MRSFQEKVIARLETIAVEAGCELVQQPEYGNEGRLIAQPVDGFSPVAHLRYHFQDGHNLIEFNGNRLSGRDTSCLFSGTDGGKIEAMFAKWTQLVRDGVAAGQPVEEPGGRHG